MNLTNLDVVIVTYNRLEKLKKTLLYYSEQTASFRNLIIVNNCSSDGTNDFLTEWIDNNRNNPKFNPIVIHPNENLGGSGGFYIGEKKAMSLDPDWILVADDDAYPDPDMIENFYDFIKSHDISAISAICGAVLNADRSVCYYHRSRIIIKKGYHFILENSTPEDYESPFFDIDVLSYVGAFIKAKVLGEVGLVNKDYFIYADDGEHSIRLREKGKLICVPSIKILHDSGQETSSKDTDIFTWRDYYATRNYIHLLIKHYKMCAINRIYHEIRRIKHIRGPQSRRMLLNAILDAVIGNLGKHKLYSPGWSINKEK